jgi:hypothetical protein
VNTNLVLVCIIVVSLTISYNEYRNPQLINAEETYTIKSVLAESPVWSSTGGDFTYEYIKFTLLDGNYFDLRNCSYKSADLERARLLSLGDSVILKTTSKAPLGQEYTVVSLISPKYGVILDTDRLNYCESGRWKTALFAAIAALVWLVARIVIKLLKLNDE